MNDLSHIQTPRELVRVAIDAARECDADPQYKLEMGEWHTPEPAPAPNNVICKVCMAGSIIAKVLGATIELFMEPACFDKRDKALLYLIDIMRRNLFVYARNEDFCDLPIIMESFFSCMVQDCNYNESVYAGINMDAMKNGDLDEWEKFYKNLID